MSTRTVVDVLVGIIPALDHIKQAIEQTTGAIPRAETQLTNVNQATELATVNILDVLDRMTGHIEAAEKAVHELRLGTGNANASLEAITQTLADTRQDASSIAMALQVQDITSQKIAGVSQVIENVRCQLLDALGQLEPGRKCPAAPGGGGAPAFDGNASFTGSTARQEDADAIIRKWNKADNE